MGHSSGQHAFKITQREKDVLVVPGFKVIQNQIEDVVALHPGVADSCAGS